MLRTSFCRFRSGLTKGFGAEGQAKQLEEVYVEHFMTGAARLGDWHALKSREGVMNLPSKEMLRKQYFGEKGFFDKHGYGGSCPSAQWLLGLYRQVKKKCVSLFSFSSLGMPTLPTNYLLAPPPPPFSSSPFLHSGDEATTSPYVQANDNARPPRGHLF